MDTPIKLLRFLDFCKTLLQLLFVKVAVVDGGSERRQGRRKEEEAMHWGHRPPRFELVYRIFHQFLVSLFLSCTKIIKICEKKKEGISRHEFCALLQWLSKTLKPSQYKCNSRTCWSFPCAYNWSITHQGAKRILRIRKEYYRVTFATTWYMVTAWSS